MPAKPAYFHRLDDALRLFFQLPDEWVDRRTVQEILGVSKTVAWRIMRRCGAGEGPGNTLVCRRDALVRSLECLRATGDFEREAGRRDRLTRYLEALAEAGRTRRTPVATQAQALDLVSSRFGRFPAGVSLTRERLTVDFASPEEFLQRIGAVIFALQNDYDAIRAFIDSNQVHSK